MPEAHSVEMFQRFTDRAKRSLLLARHEARRLHHDSVGTEHLLLGLIAEGEGVAAAVLQPLGVEAEGLRAAILAFSSGPDEAHDA